MTLARDCRAEDAAPCLAKPEAIVSVEVERIAEGLQNKYVVQWTRTWETRRFVPMSCYTSVRTGLASMFAKNTARCDHASNTNGNHTIHIRLIVMWLSAIVERSFRDHCRPPTTTSKTDICVGLCQPGFGERMVSLDRLRTA